MPQPKVQTFENHVRYVPTYHGVALPIFVVNLAWAVYRLIARPTLDAVVALLLAAGLLLLFFHARHFALTVQDRVIRLEMRLRLARLLPPDLQGRIEEFNVDQLVALRFASDEELPELARKVLTERLSDRTTIKRLIKYWQADHLRV